MIVGDSRCPENAAPSPFVIDTQRLSKLNVDEDNPSAEITSFFDNSKHELFPGKISSILVLIFMMEIFPKLFNLLRSVFRLPKLWLGSEIENIKFNM